MRTRDAGKVSLRGRAAAATTSTSATRADGNAAVLGQLKAVGGRVRGGGVDTNHDPLEDAVADAVAQEDVVEDGVRGGAGRLLLAKDAVLGVGRQRDGVGVVRAQRLDLRRQALVPEEVANVRHRAHGDGAVGFFRGLGVQDDVHVVGAARVVARVNGCEKFGQTHSLVVGGMTYS